MTKARHSGNGPTGEDEAYPEASDDLSAIRRDAMLFRESMALWQRLFPDGDRFRRDFEFVATAAHAWPAASLGQRVRALLILARRFGVENVRFLALSAAPKSNQTWMLSVRPRTSSEKHDGGKRDRLRARDDLAQSVGREVYERIKSGQSKSGAVAATKKAFREGEPHPADGSVPPIPRQRLPLPSHDGVEKILAVFRRNALRRGYVDPLAPYFYPTGHSEPDLKVSDLPKRGRPRKK